MGKQSRKKQRGGSPGEAPPVVERPPPVRPALTVLLAVYFAGAVAVATIVPWDARIAPKVVPPDEGSHWGYVCDLATGRGLPVFSSGDSNYEAHQPPLYYLTAVWTVWLAGDRGLWLGRLWSAVLGGLTLLVAWKGSEYLLGSRFWPRLAAVGLLAFVPGRLFIVSSVSNDPLFELCAATVLWLVLRALAKGLNVKHAALLGAALGSALLSKTSALALAPVVGFALVFEPSWRTGGLKTLLRNAALVGVAVALLWGWWIARNYHLYGEPLALDIFQRIFLKDRATPEFFLSRGLSWGGYWTLVAFQTWLSTWGVFGQATVYMPATFYLLGTGLTGAGAVGLLIRLLPRRREVGRLRPSPAWAAALLTLLLALASFLRFNTIFYQAQARYLLGASVVLACLLASGVTALTGERDTPWPAAIATGLLAALSLWAILAHVTGDYSLMPPWLTGG